MYKVLLLSALFFLTAFKVSAQQPIDSKKDSVIKRTDSVRPKYVNQGKIAGRRAVLSSLMLPGLGQIRNGVTVYRLVKVAGIYTGATLLTISFIDNSKGYKLFYNELLYRRANGGQKSPEFPYANVDETGLITAKDLFRRNKEVIIFSYIGLYLAGAIEAYIDARLKYFDVGDVAFKVSPGMINTGTMYGYNQFTPGITLTLKL